MTPQQLWKLAFRTAEAKLRTSGPVFSEAEIMAEFPLIGTVEEFPFKWKQVVNTDLIDEKEITSEFAELMRSRIEAAIEDGKE